MKHVHAEIGQYEILTVFLINVYSGIKEHDMNLSKDDKLMPCVHYRYQDEGI